MMAIFRPTPLDKSLLIVDLFEPAAGIHLSHRIQVSSYPRYRGVGGSRRGVIHRSRPYGSASTSWSRRDGRGRARGWDCGCWRGGEATTVLGPCWGDYPRVHWCGDGGSGGRRPVQARRTARELFGLGPKATA